ncbi:hypothetical protein KIH39_04030 [Telmatocola sphagniphila]|uniref:Uncharacterized protein n=1 Tax=Telmatocola sphagniphila TaxID=1123043 RepID=A0A8E6B9L9_9BACT|nr:hypothetical protein [Telmatocola sphagniphila]QVL33093.1 hypothetical protein KIH39_04030 [Telmatocola sphagniphila]
MIQRPKQSVTRFFIPLIDVLILLFCIFLLMPFVSQAGNPGEGPDLNPENELPTEEALPKDVESLRQELERNRRELQRLRAEQGDISEKLAIKLLEVDLATGKLITYTNGQRQEISDQSEAEKMIDQHIRASGGREPLFLILLPKRGAPLQQHIENYRRWFAGVSYSFDEAVTPRSKQGNR